MSIFCEHCGYSNADDAKTCSNCYKPIVIIPNSKIKYYYIYPEKCSNCGANLIGQPDKCESCGSEIKAEKFTKKSFSGYFEFKMFSKIVFIIGILFLVIFLLFKPFGGSEERTQRHWSKNDNTTTAYVIMQNFVEKQLKSPSTAKFPSIINEEVKIVKKDNQTYIMTSFVDSQNSFGAVIRTYFVGEIQQVSEDKWKLISLRFVED